MKHNRLFWFLSLLICVNPSCFLIPQAAKTSDVRIESLTVSPKSGSGAFSVTVKFSQHKDSDNILCYVPNGSGDGVDVFTKSIGASDTSENFEFNYTKPGTHSLECSVNHNGYVAGFTVISGPNSALEQFKTATLSYLSYINQTVPGKGGPPNWCFTGDTSGGTPVPPLTIAFDGSLKSECVGGMSKYFTWNGTTTGQWNPMTGEVTWTMQMLIEEANSSGASITTTKLRCMAAAPFLLHPMARLALKARLRGPTPASPAVSWMAIYHAPPAINRNRSIGLAR